jgi:multidrug efflux pump subunit AcrA (membrane-fusion protein)
MNKLGKIAPIVVILACLGSLFLAFTVAKKKAQHIAQIASLNGTLTATKAELNKTKGTLKQAQADLTKTKGDLDQANATLVTTKAALDQKTQEASSLLTQLTDATNQLALTKADLATAQATRKNIEAALNDIGITNVSNIAELRDRIVSMGEENKVLGKQLMAMHTENEQLKTRIEELSTTPVGLRGHVSVVQGKWGFIVMDLGHSQRVQPNSEFLVYRDSKFVGKVQVVSVAANNCIAQILPAYLKHPPLPGDLVVH